MSDLPPFSKSLDACPYGPRLQKYWDRRFDLFSRFDQGIQLDEEALFSVKPEVHAVEIASRMIGTTIVDGFCGVGGVSIALARLGKKVIAVDLNEARLDMAKENAKIYRCEDHITFIHDDFLNFVKTVKVGTPVYLDPPWGGPDYSQKRSFLLEDFSPSGNAILEAALRVAQQVAFSVPTNFSLDEIKKYNVNFEVRGSEAWGRPIFSTLYIDTSGYEKVRKR